LPSPGDVNSQQHCFFVRYVALSVTQATIQFYAKRLEVAFGSASMSLVRWFCVNESGWNSLP